MAPWNTNEKVSISQKIWRKLSGRGSCETEPKMVEMVVIRRTKAPSTREVTSSRLSLDSLHVSTTEDDTFHLPTGRHEDVRKEIEHSDNLRIVAPDLVNWKVPQRVSTLRPAPGPKKYSKQETLRLAYFKSEYNYRAYFAWFYQGGRILTPAEWHYEDILWRH